MIKINRKSFKEHLISHNNGECVSCDMATRKKEDTVCDPCIMKVHSKQGLDKDGNPKYGCSLKSRSVPFMKEFEPKVRIEVGKCQAFFYLYYPELNYKLPDDPKMDVLGQYNKKFLTENQIKDLGKNCKVLKYVIHHIDENHNNDRQDNLALVVNSEHSKLHSKTLNPLVRETLIKDIKARNLKILGYEYWG